MLRDGEQLSVALGGNGRCSRILTPLSIGSHVLCVGHADGFLPLLPVTLAITLTPP
jgi:hypothetical protein